MANRNTDNYYHLAMSRLRLIEKYKADKKFLLARCAKAGSCSFCKERDTGVSSNSIVAIAYGKIKLNEQDMPSDEADLAACIKAFGKLPRHRKTKNAIEALSRAKQALRKKGK